MQKILFVGMGMASNPKRVIAIIEVSNFLKENDYTYEITDLIEGLKKRKEGYYNSHTMNHCLDSLTKNIEILSYAI